MVRINKEALGGRKKFERCDGRVFVVSAGDWEIRDSANRAGDPLQKQFDSQLQEALLAAGYTEVVFVHVKDEKAGHRLINSKAAANEVFVRIPSRAPVVVSAALWLYSGFLTRRLHLHKGPKLIAANLDGRAPGMVGMLNLRASCVKLGIDVASVWGDPSKEIYRMRLTEWREKGSISYDTAKLTSPFNSLQLQQRIKEIGERIFGRMDENPIRILVFDEGCMEMVNAELDDTIWNAVGAEKVRYTQAQLLVEMDLVTEEEVDTIFDWLVNRRVTFVQPNGDKGLGYREKDQLTANQIKEGIRMYIALVRLADINHCNGVAVQYQQGLKDSRSSSDLAEALCNDKDRPDVVRQGTDIVLFEGQALGCANEADQPHAIDMGVAHRVLREIGQHEAFTLHDFRWYDRVRKGKSPVEAAVDVIVAEISGAVPFAHLVGEHAGATFERQPPEYFPKGGATVKGVCKPGYWVWSRIHFELDKGVATLGLATGHELSKEETQRRWDATTPQWPILHTTLAGLTADELMMILMSNHFGWAHADSEKSAIEIVLVRAYVLQQMGFEVRLAGTGYNGEDWQTLAEAN